MPVQNANIRAFNFYAESYAMCSSWLLQACGLCSYRNSGNTVQGELCFYFSSWYVFILLTLYLRLMSKEGLKGKGTVGCLNFLVFLCHCSISGWLVQQSNPVKKGYGRTLGLPSLCIQSQLWFARKASRAPGLCVPLLSSKGARLPCAHFDSHRAPWTVPLSAPCANGGRGWHTCVLDLLPLLMHTLHCPTGFHF